MKKSDLINGLVVTLRLGEECLVVGSMLIKNNFRFNMHLDNFNEDLTHKEHKHLDIVKVQQLNKECVLWERKEIDWSKVPVDTKVLVRNSEKESWRKRYFAKYINGKYVCYASGTTSWSDEKTKSMTTWKYCELLEEPEREVTYKELKKEYLDFMEPEVYGYDCDEEEIECLTEWLLNNYNVTRK